jgi:translation initiation factor IF-2
MSETTVKKQKIYTLSIEINVAADTILEFLQKKNFKVKSLNSVLDDAMVEAARREFADDVKEKEQRERQKVEKEEQAKLIERKIEEKKTHIVKPVTKVPLVRKRPLKKELLSATPVVEPLTALPSVVEIIPPVPQEIPETVLLPEQEKAKEFEELIFEQEPKETVEIEREIVEQPTEKVSLPISVPEEPSIVRPQRIVKKKKEVVSGLERERGKKIGITIVGKIDLSKGKKKDEEGVSLTAEESPPVKKKVKKKKLKQSKVDEQEDLAKKRQKEVRHRLHSVDEKEVSRNIDETLAEMGTGTELSNKLRERKNRKERKLKEKEERIQKTIDIEKTVVRVTEFISVSELANIMHVNVADVIQKCFSLGKMVTINQRLEKDIIELLAMEFGRTIEFQKEFTSDVLLDVEDPDELLKTRPPVVTIMGHVDHGKTSLLDYIRKANVVAGEAGGITQHIGAYEVTLTNDRQITFLDTPGHEAFTAMRARGAQVTDIVVIVVAADESVMPQTLEAISHAQAAGVPLVIAINKMDKPGANPDQIRLQLSKKNVLVEEFGGKYQSVEISAKKGVNIDVLLEKILLEADILELKANPNRKARGTVIEVKLDKGKGTVATVLVQKGTLRVGDPFVCGFVSGRVRAMFDEREKRVEAAHPSTPVQVTGFDGTPQAGDEFVAVEYERDARGISLQRSQLKREQDFRQRHLMTLDDISKQIKEGKVQDLNVVIKGDVDGSVEAISDSLQKLSTAEVRVNVVYRAVGAITEGDVLLAAASNAVIVAFNVRPTLNARRLAAQESVDIRMYTIIYDAINEVRTALEGMLAPEIKEEVTATVDVRDTFKLPKGIMVAGCYVSDGTISRNSRIRLIRDGIVVFTGGLASLKRFKDDVREVLQGFECGIALDGFNDVKVGDVIESFKTVEMKRTL